MASSVLLVASVTQLTLHISPFSAPSDLTATAVSVSQIDLNWSAVSAAVSYKVYRNSVLIASPAANSYSDIGLTSATTYSYAVSGVDVNGTESSLSDFVSATTLPGGEEEEGGGGGGGGGELPPAPIPEAVYSSADFNSDGVVSSVDFSILLYFWKTQPPFRNPRVDINKDSQVNSIDFSILLYHWGSKRLVYYE
jgi:hypothetical protein